MAGLFSKAVYLGLPTPTPATPLLVTWTGASGSVYEFQVDRIPTTYQAVGGVYVFCHFVQRIGWLADYIGQTDDFSVRIDRDLVCHHCWPCICRAGSTHIGTYRATDAIARALVETDLIRGIKTPCNRT